MEQKSETEIHNERLRIELARDKEKFKVRRMMASLSFMFLIVITLALLTLPAILTSEQAESLSNFSSMIITCLGVFGGVVGAYMAAVTYTDTRK